MRVLPVTLGLFWLAGTAVAATADGQMGVQLTQTLYCDTKSLIGGNIGLLVGLGIALLGLYKLTQGGGFGAVILIAVGATVTAVPSLIESSLSGLGGILQGAGISNSSKPTSVKC